MALKWLDINGFRNLHSAKFQPLLRGFNYIYGDNGSGKTSLLEAIYYLSLGRSFRSHITDRIIQHSADKLCLFANVALNEEQHISIGLERDSQGDLRLRMNGKDAQSITDLTTLLPIQLIDSHCHHLIDAGPVFRRKYLDWGVFYLNKHFLMQWRLYERALRQRNGALRAHCSQKELDSWTHSLLEHAMQLHQMRSEYISELLPILEETVGELLSMKSIKIHYYAGWDQAIDLYTILTGSLARDRQLHYTQFGPHRADLKVTIQGTPAKDILSRGQQKMFVCAMMLARGALLQKGSQTRPIYLVDDLPSELDEINRTNLLALLARQEAQIFVTAVERNCDNFLASTPVKMFHVEHGIVKDVFSNVE